MSVFDGLLVLGGLTVACLIILVSAIMLTAFK